MSYNVENAGNMAIEKNFSICQNEFAVSHIPSTILQDNLAPNPSFEYGNELPDGWIHGRYAKYVWDNEYAHTGNKSIGIVNLKPSLPQWYTADLIPIDPINNIYAFGVWYKYYAPPFQNNFGGIGITGLDKNGHQVGVTWVLHLPYIDNEWHYFQYICNPYFNQTRLKEIKYATLNLFYWVWNNANSSEGIRFDDVFFGKGEFPVIEIESLRGFFGIVSVTVKNTGSADAENIPWEINLLPVGGKIFSGERTTGIIEKLPAGESVTIKSDFIFGFGSAYISVVADGDTISKGYFIIGPLLIEVT